VLVVRYIRFVCVVGACVAAALVVPALAGAVGGSDARVKSVISPLLTGDAVTGVRGESGQKAVLTGGVNVGTGLNPAVPFLVEAPLTGPISATVEHPQR
jgi:hypothetical protein